MIFFVILPVGVSTMTNSKKNDRFTDDYDDLEYEMQIDSSSYDSGSKKRKRLDPYNKEKERRNSKINPRFIEFEDDEF